MPHIVRRRSVHLLLLATLVAAPIARASCGAAFCTLNTAWEAQGVPVDPGVRLDLRYEYIDQDQPRAGHHKVGVGEIPQHHDEVRTLNRNLVTTLDYTADADWGISAQLPLVKRDHSHIHNHQGAKLFDSWHFQELGDVRVLARRRLSNAGDTAQGVTGGVKLPTGDTDIRNDAGEFAERSLQPGTGTTDLIAGYYAHSMRLLGDVPARLFLQAQVQAPVNQRTGYRPGVQYAADFGVAYPAAGTWSGLLQINASIRDRDRGPEAEPKDSGGSFVWLSPGVSYAVNRETQIYSFVQLPLYQRVNGIQLTASWTAAAGAVWRF